MKKTTPADNCTSILKELKSHVTIPKERRTAFFKTEKGDYAEHDKFLGVKMAPIRKLAKKYSSLDSEFCLKLLHSEFNEARLLALIILVHQFQSGDQRKKKAIYELYLQNSQQINNWNLVDASAHLIVGAYLLNKDKKPLLQLTRSKDLWVRRIAIVATWTFIRNQKLDWTFRLAKLLLNDPEDLMHKATGWILREAGKKDEAKLVSFLNENKQEMPRTMLRYAIERFNKIKRAAFLKTEHSSL